MLHRCDIVLIKRTKWLCPTCTELSATRHWSVRRHIQRKHDGVGEPISVNTYQTRDQMHMASSVTDSYTSPSSNLTQTNSRTNNLGDLLGYQKNPFRSFGPQTTVPIPQRIENSDTSMSKLEEIVRLSHQYYHPQFASNLLSGLYSLMFVMEEAKWESIIDEILKHLRIRANMF